MTNVPPPPPPDHSPHDAPPPPDGSGLPLPPPPAAVNPLPPPPDASSSRPTGENHTTAEGVVTPGEPEPSDLTPLDEIQQSLTDAQDTGRFTSKRELLNENKALRAAFEQIGATERAMIRAEITSLREDARSARDERTAQIETELSRMRSELESTETQLREAKAELSKAKQTLIVVRDEQALQEVGIYEYSHPLASSIEYKAKIAALQDRFKSMARNKNAIVGSTNWTVNGSSREGAKMVSDFSKLMLRAYNNEVDNAVRSMRPYKLQSSIDRVEKARKAISRLGKTMSIEVTESYHRARVEELRLTAGYLAKVAEEKEQERAEKARLREEAKARRDFERETARLTKEAAHYTSAISAMRANGDEAGASEAEAKLAEINDAIAGVEARAANVRAGYVYVISNIGSFGEKMVKIGMTRRLDPNDRVRELGDASVPFRYDVHALIFSEDAVSLETNLHQHFREARVNMVNNRREFFFVNPTDVRDVLANLEGNLLSFEDTPEALEWRQSENLRAHTAAATG